MTFPPSFRRQWLASGISNIGDGMDAAAGPLLAALLTNDPRLIALVGVGLTLPWLLLSLPLGVVIDRLDRKVLMVRANVARCVLFAFVAVLASTVRCASGYSSRSSRSSGSARSSSTCPPRRSCLQSFPRRCSKEPTVDCSPPRSYATPFSDFLWAHGHSWPPSEPRLR